MGSDIKGEGTIAPPMANILRMYLIFKFRGPLTISKLYASTFLIGILEDPLSCGLKILIENVEILQTTVEFFKA